MAQFKNSYASHEHSLQTLMLLYGYDSFLDSLEVVCDMGCGEGRDLAWWAELETREDPPEPRNYICYGVDRNIRQVDHTVKSLKNVWTFEEDYSTVVLPRKADLLWSHDSFQYSTNPLATLRHWNGQMNVDGMLVMMLPQHSGYQYNRYVNRAHSYCYFNYNLCNMVYMLAVNGFDCRDAYFYKDVNNEWMHLAVYKTDQAPMDPSTTDLYQLVERDLLHPSVVDSISKYGYLRQEDIIYPWLDKDFYYVKD